MIRPFTCLCVLMAAGSGLYLYQTKHRSQMLDREIVKTVNDTQQTRERIASLKTEYAFLNQQDRLQALADKFLTLKPTEPQQFVQLGDLDSRLPPPRVKTGPAMDDDDVDPAPHAPAAAPIPPPAATPPGVTPPGVTPVAAAQPTPPTAPPRSTPALAAAAPALVATNSAPRVTPRPAAEKPAADKPAPEKAPEKALEKSPERAPEKAPEKLAERTPEKPPERTSEKTAAERPAEPAVRRPVPQEAARPAVHSGPVAVGAPVYQTVAPMPSTRSAVYTPYGVPAMTSALGSYRTPLAAPVPVGGAAVGGEAR